MRKKENHPPHHNQPSSKLFIISSAFKHYERDRIDSAAVHNFICLIHSLTLRILKHSNQPDVAQLYKITNQLIVGFLANLSEQTYRHTCSHEDIINFFVVMATYFEKSVNAFGMNDAVIKSGILSIFCPISSKALQSAKGMNQNKIQLINTLVQSIEEPKKQKINYGTFVRESFTIMAQSGQKELGVKEILIAFLRNSSVVPNFKPTLIKFITIAMGEGLEEQFKKSLLIFEHVGSTFEERRINMESLLLRTLEYNHCITYLAAIQSCINISKLVTPTNLPEAVLRITDKLFSKDNLNANCLNILEELGQINLLEQKQISCEKLVFKGDHLVARFLEWVLMRYVKKEKSQNNLENQTILLQRELDEQNYELKEEKFLQFVKKLSNKNIFEADEEKSCELKKVCQYFTQFIKNMCRHPSLREKLIIKDLDSLTILKNTQKWCNQTIKGFILEVIPPLISELVFNLRDKSALKHAIMVRAAELSAAKSLQACISLTTQFKEIYFQMLQTQSLNYHYALCFLFLRYQKDREGIRDLIVVSILGELQREEKNKNSRNLILNLSLFLKSYDHLLLSQPIKYKVRQLSKNTQQLVSKLDINQLLGVQPKQYTSLRHHQIQFDSKVQKMKTLLNKQLSNFECRQHLNLLYSLIIAVNDLVELPENEDVEHSLLTQITSLRKRAMLGQVYTIIHLLNEAIIETTNNYTFSHPKKIEIFLLLLKLQQLSKANLLVSSEDSEHLYSLLTEYMILINSSLNNELLENLNNFKANPSNYNYERYQGYLEERQIIKFYSESSRDAFQLHIIMSRICFSMLSKLMEMKGLQFSSLSTKLQTLIQLYSTHDALIKYGFASDHEQKLKYYIMLLLLQQKVRSGLPYENLVKKIIPFASQIKDIVLHSRDSQHLSSFQQLYPIDFFCICLTAIRQVLRCDEKQSRSLFQLVTKVIEEDDKNDSSLSRNLMKTLESQLASVACKQILERAKRGLQLENKEVFYEQSSTLYKLISKAVEKDKAHLVKLVEDLIQLDCYTNSEQSAFILRQISFIFTYVEERSSEICEIIFNYILTLTEIFVGEEKLQISTFICQFFGLKVNQQQQLNLNSLEKPVSLTCGSSVNYKCLQCDQKKIICMGCSITCHQNHPICFLNIPVEYKFAKCQCCEIGNNNCKLINKDNPQKHNSFYKPKDFPIYKPPVQGLMGPPPEIYERMKLISNPFPSRYSRESSLQGQDRYESMSRYEIQSLIREEELIEQEMRANKWYENMRKGNRDRDREEFFNRFAGSRVQKMIDRDDYPGSYRMFIQGNEGRRQPKFPPQLQKEKEKDESIRQTTELEFLDEEYQQEMFEDIKVGQPETEESSTILKKYVLLPKFIDLMVNFCNKKSDKSKSLTSIERWKLSFINPQVSKLAQGSAFKIHNSGSFTFEIRKENAIHNMSCVLIKKTVANNHRYVLVASSTEISVFSLQKVLLCISQMKMIPGYNSISRHSISFEVHSLDFSPVDKSIFCASGLHNLALLSINNQGHISRTSFRYNVSNFYINKIKLTKMGIFVGIDKEIRVLNYSCKHFLTLRAQQSHTMIREWTVFEKAAGCQVLFVCPNGNIFTTDILASDEDKKEFVGKITDSRANKTGVGVSMAAKDLADFGKYLFAAFKDGSNILGRLEGDQLEDMVNMQLKGLKYQKNIFDGNFIIGHAQIIKLPQADELYLICTVKKYFPPEMSFHQGILVAIKFKKNADKNQSNSEIIVLNDQINCEFFKVIKLSKKNFFIYSVHSDGSVQITALNKVSKQNIQEQLISIRQSQQKDNLQQNGDNKQAQSLSSLRKNLAKLIKIQNLVNRPQLNSSYSFREGTEALKSGSDYVLIKHNETDFEFKYNSFSKIVTGFSVPFFGQVTLPTRTTSPTFQVGFTQLEALYFFGEGSFKFKYKRSEQKRYSRQSFCNPNNSHPRMVQRLQRIERLSEYHQGDKLINSHLMSSILGFKEDTNTDIQFVGKAFQVFKAKIPKFEDIFKSEGDDQTSSIQKTALIIKMFLAKSLKEGNPCSQEQILQLISGIKSIIASSSKRLFILLKEIVVLASQVYQKQTGRYFSVSQQNYPLRVATENRVEHYFNILKVDICDNELNEFLSFLIDILEEDQDLMALYVSKYSGIFTQLHRRLKKADTEERAKHLIQLYTFAYPILKYCSIPCSWILSSICAITFSFFSSKAVRETLYQGFKRSKQISLQQWLKNVCSSEGLVQEVEPINIRQKQQVQEPKDQMFEIYNMYNRGEIDEQAMFKMISEASKLQYERQQQNQMVLEQECQEVQPQLQKQMEVEENIINHNIALILDLTDQCTDSFNENVELTYSRIMTLYVLSKAVDKYFEQTTNHLLKRIKKMVAEIDLKAQGDKLQSILSYACLFNRILNNSQYLKRNNGKRYLPYVEIQELVNQKLAKIRLESVPKISKQPDLLGRIFKDEKAAFNIHIAYALTSLLLFPCEASHALLSLQCYWLLPESKEFYSKKKDFSNITDGIESGNIQKVYQIAKQNPLIWQEYNNIYNKLGFVEEWIEEKRNNWQLALELISIYYQD